MRTRFFLIASLLLTGTSPALANESTYTDLDTDHCKTIGPEKEEGGGITLLCKGLEDYPVTFKEGDLRQSVFFGKLGKAYTEGAFETFGPFNHVGRKIEWRIDGDVPVATILRWFIENSDPDTGMPTKALRGQVLVVSKVAQADGIGCIAGYVDALSNPEPNVLARQVADEIAPGFECAVDEAVFHGKRGEKASTPMRNFPR
ncbi:hypothetical protein [Pararhizobium sp. O133]|uniref:hypothetical protein n=1 Tax=Pararhizobium sp. O133 TaxID=3449278 RepID=UPI003F686C8B